MTARRRDRIARAEVVTIDPSDRGHLTSSHLKTEMLSVDRFILSSSEMSDAPPRAIPMSSNSSNRVSRRSTKETVNDAPTIDLQIGKAVIEIT